MGIFKKNETSAESSADSSLSQQLSEQANRLGLSVTDLKSLGTGKSCPKYGTKELLHARRVKGGKIAVFNISEKYRGEKISDGRKKIKAAKVATDAVSNETDKK
ncbi:MAG: hypothetical protein IPK68_11165 [Bdellovibrionales bacterium]|nr:hypothetical protein [Bdellovibrionales bacterium]